MARAIWKGPYVCNKLISDVKKGRKIIKTTSRSTRIIPEFVGKTVHVHNGLKFYPVTITEKMIGSKLGSFSLPKKVAVYRKTKKKKKSR